MPAVIPRREPLDRVKIVAAAVMFADEKGIGGLSMRKLGESLGVEAMSLYNHISNKRDLLAGMIDSVFAEIELPTPVDSAHHWIDQLRRRSNSLRDALSRHPWAISLMDSSPTPGPHTLRHHDAVIGSLRAAGFSVDMTAHAFSAIDSYVYGFAMQEKSLPFETPEETAELAQAILASFAEDTYPHLREMALEHVLKPGYRYRDEFGLGLEILLEGLENRRGPG